MSDYDRWLEKPYVDAAREEERYERFCEERGLDPCDDDSLEAFEDAMEEVE